VIEVEPRQHRFPATSGVARVAGLLEFTAVRIDVASGAGVKLHVFVSRGTARGIGLVAFLASHLDVQPGQRITRLGVVELLGSLPAFHVVALGALVAELSFVCIGVTGRAIRRLAEERFGGILVLDEGLDLRKHVRGGVTFLARNGGVLAFQGVAREAVIELLF
jgi:hypothetical protein